MKKLTWLWVFLLVFVLSSEVMGTTITFWTMNYGDTASQTKMLDELTADFKNKTGIEVKYEIVNWSQAFNKYMLISGGGPGPDCADMYWAYTFSTMGQGKYGPMDISSELKRYGGRRGLEKRWYAPSLQDVFFGDKWYGFPWRIDIRITAYRADWMKEIGISRAPNTWNELVLFGQKLTKRDPSGKVIRWGVGIDGKNPQTFYSWLWQAGGEFLTPDNKKSAINSPAGKEALQFLVDLIHKYKICPPDCIDPGFNLTAAFKAGLIGILPSGVGAGFKREIERTAPQLLGKVAGAIPLKNKKRITFQGAGYFGILHGVKDKEAALKWLEYLTQDDVQIRYSKVSETLSPLKNVNKDPYFAEDWWYKACIASLPYGRTSQHQTPAWTQITNPEPTGIIYDMLQDALSGRKSVEEALATAEKRMNEVLSKY
jgi:ABC-type glycerol-3-phosphate transport system substrate-binding protein